MTKDGGRMVKSQGEGRWGSVMDLRWMMGMISIDRSPVRVAIMTSLVGMCNHYAEIDLLAVP
jgi:hypothetical protein